MNELLPKMKAVMRQCEHYDFIVNFSYCEEDLLTKIFIDYYRDYIEAMDLTSMEDWDLISAYDQSLFQYLSNHEFYKLVQQKYCTDNEWGNFIIYTLNRFYEFYLDMTQATLKATKWL